MKKIILSLLTIGLLMGSSRGNFSSGENIQGEDLQVVRMVEENLESIPLNIRAKSAYMTDERFQNLMYSKNETERLPIASMCKIMTLLLCFEAEEKGALSFDEEITVSENAASMGGSQVFLEANAAYKTKELIKSIVVCSANDSCVAMAERIAGSEQLFVDKMNQKAKEIGAENTLFANCTGLPKQPQYSCAKDVAIMLKHLLSYPQYYQFGKVWTDKFQHPQGRYTEITNTNKLVRFYDGCDGGKTGFTNEAGFCLAATAKRNNQRIISVVIGEENSKNRFADTCSLFDYAFSNYITTTIVEENVSIEEQAEILGGKTKKVKAYPEKNVLVCQKRDKSKNYTTEVSFIKLKAPIEKDTCIGNLTVYKDGVEIDKIKLLAAEAVKKSTIFDELKNVVGHWNKK